MFLIFSNPENFRKLIFQSALRISSLVEICEIKSNYIFPGRSGDYGPGHQLGRQQKKRSGKESPKATTNKTTTFTIVIASKIQFSPSIYLILKKHVFLFPRVHNGFFHQLICEGNGLRLLMQRAFSYQVYLFNLSHFFHKFYKIIIMRRKESFIILYVKKQYLSFTVCFANNGACEV